MRQLNFFVVASTLLMGASALADSQAQILARCSDRVYQENKAWIDEQHNEAPKKISVSFSRQPGNISEMNNKAIIDKYDRIDAKIIPLERKCVQEEMAKQAFDRIEAEELAVSVALPPVQATPADLRAPASVPTSN